MKQLFQVTLEMLDSVAHKTIWATYQDMYEMGIAKPPYPEFAIALSGAAQLSRSGIPVIEFHYAPAKDHPEIAKFVVELTRGGRHVPVSDYPFDSICIGLDAPGYAMGTGDIRDAFNWMVEEDGGGREAAALEAANMVDIYVTLIVLLATKNVVKEVHHNKLAKFGVGKQRAEYVTTLKIGTVTETEYENGTPSGREVRPHLRRGHVRNQRHGPELSFVKKVWIDPVFINSDREYVPSERVAYNVSRR